MLSVVAGIRIPRLELNPPSPRHLSYWTPHLTEIANERWLSSTTPSKWTNLFDRLGNMKTIFVIFLKQFYYLGCSFYPLTVDSVYFVVFFTLRFLAPFFSLKQSKYPTHAQTHTRITHIHTIHERDFRCFPLLLRLRLLLMIYLLNQLVWNFGRVREGELVLIFLVLSRHLYIHRKDLVFPIIARQFRKLLLPYVLCIR